VIRPGYVCRANLEDEGYSHFCQQSVPILPLFLLAIKRTRTHLPSSRSSFQFPLPSFVLPPLPSCHFYVPQLTSPLLHCFQRSDTAPNATNAISTETQKKTRTSRPLVLELENSGNGRKLIGVEVEWVAVLVGTWRALSGLGT